MDTFWVRFYFVETFSPKPTATMIANSPGASIMHSSRAVLYFWKKLVGSCNCLNCAEKKVVFAKAAAATWKARFCFGHNQAAKSLVAASSASAWWVSQQPAPWLPTPLSPCWSCWASRGKTKALSPEYCTGRWGWMWIQCCRPTSANAQWQPGLLARTGCEPLFTQQCLPVWSWSSSSIF